MDAIFRCGVTALVLQRHNHTACLARACKRRKRRKQQLRRRHASHGGAEPSPIRTCPCPGETRRRQRAEAAAAAAEARAAQAQRAVGQIFDQVFGVVVPPLAMEQEHVHEVERDYVERAAAAEAAAMAAELAEGDYADSMGVWLDELHAVEEAARAERLRLIVEQEARDNAVPLHQRECSICLEALHEGENGAYTQLGCHETHGFHADCLARSWASDPRLRCPACRSPRVVECRRSGARWRRQCCRASVRGRTPTASTRRSCAGSVTSGTPARRRCGLTRCTTSSLRAALWLVGGTPLTICRWRSA